jgi:hypothetical protein
MKIAEYRCTVPRTRILVAFLFLIGEPIRDDFESSPHRNQSFAVIERRSYIACQKCPKDKKDQGGEGRET